jgi:3-oxoacyl-[acyl-carrier protein] reductase
MDLGIKNQNFLIGGASSGFGLSISKALIAEGANVIAIARNMEKLQELKKLSPGNVQVLQADLTLEETMDKIDKILQKIPLSGAVLNAGGPPAMSYSETRLEDWDNAYRNILRWKVDLTSRIIEGMLSRKYGRILFIESLSIKQPIENLILSNSLRLAVTGFVKSLSQEIAGNGVNLNILAPGYHDTAAIKRLVIKKSEKLGISPEEAKAELINSIPAGFLGKADDFASLASWLLSPHSAYINGQSISVDGGVIKGIFG